MTPTQEEQIRKEFVKEFGLSEIPDNQTKTWHDSICNWWMAKMALSVEEKVKDRTIEILSVLKDENTNKWDDAVHCSCLPAAIEELEETYL